MTELEQYKKAYSTLAGRIDALTTKLEKIDKNFVIEGATIDYTIHALVEALQEAEDIFLDEDPTDLEETDSGATSSGEIHLMK